MKECLFCCIVDKKQKARIILEDEVAVAFEDIHPQAPVHVLLIPRKHMGSLNEVQGMDREVLGHLLLMAAKVAEMKQVHRSGYRLVINTNAQAGQTVFHLHVHLLGGRTMTWPPG
jgi:histidine triad (HIT) family protein